MKQLLIIPSLILLFGSCFYLNKHNFKVSKKKTFALIFGVFITWNVAADPIAELTATRLSGPAPLAVFFDATHTTDTDSSIDTFRELGYSFCFGETSNDVWTPSNLSKNVETGGPLAAHVYDFPGTYDVTLLVTSPNGSTSETFLTIIVYEPDVFYEGANTVVISTGADFSEAPSGARQLSNVTSWPVWESNKRYLLKAGDDFTILNGIQISDQSNFHLGSFGTGNKPIVTQVTIDMDEDNAATPPENAVVQGLNVPFILQRLMFKNLLIYENDVIGDGANIVFASANTWYAINQRGDSSPEDWVQPGPIFVIENNVNMLGDPTGYQNAIAGMGHHLAILGNTSEQAKEHTLRVFAAYKSIIGHNLLTGPATDTLRTDFKLMSNGVNDWPENHAIFHSGTTTEILPNTQYIRISDNTFGRTDAVHSWHLQVAPQDDGNSNTIEGLRDIIIEKNTFIDGTQDNGLERAIQTLGHNIIERENQFPAIWSQPILEEAYPSNYSDYSNLYTPFWHGPYHINDIMPITNNNLCQTLSIETFIPEQSIKVFPNPLNKDESLKVILPRDTMSSYIEIFDIMGKKIYSKEFIEKNIEIPNNTFTTGIYLITIHSNHNVETKKIIVVN